MDKRQSVEQPLGNAPVPRPGGLHVSDPARLWAEVREYRRRREAWESELERLLQAHHELEALHFELMLHAVEVAALADGREARAGVLPPPGEGPGFDERMDLYERSLLDAALARTHGCRRKAAELLGLLPTTLCEKLKRLGVVRHAH